MASNRKILLLPGDGIGPEVTRQSARVLEYFDKRRIASFDVKEDLVGGAAIDRHGTPLTEGAMKAALEADAILLGAVGGPKWDSLPFAQKPERGLLRLRKDMELFANLRPAFVFPALADASTLKREVVDGLDLIIVRELTGGAYFGEPRGITNLPNGGRKRGRRVCSVEKANVMESGVLWREEVTKLHAAEYGDVRLSHMYADNCAMQLVRNPKQFDVIVTDNLFGDILSDCAAMLTGSLGMLPSASLGAPDKSGRRKALYEPVHGSAPDIAGKNLANPLASILSLAMMLRYSFDMDGEAKLVERAVANALAGGARTGDIAQADAGRVSTSEMGDRVLAELQRLT